MAASAPGASVTSASRASGYPPLESSDLPPLVAQEAPLPTLLGGRKRCASSGDVAKPDQAKHHGVRPRGSSLDLELGLARKRPSQESLHVLPPARTTSFVELTPRLRAEISAEMASADAILQGSLGGPNALSSKRALIGRLADPNAAYEKITSIVNQIPLPNRPQMRFSFYASLYSRHQNASFAEDWRAAVRGAVFALVLAVPLMIPTPMLHQHLSWLEWLRERNFYSQSTVTLYMFSLWRPLGPTVELVKEATAGMCLWFIVQAALCHFFPAGAFPDGENMDAFAFGVIVGSGVLFLCAALFLNLACNTVVWTLSTFVFAWMDLLRPRGTDGHTLEKSLGSVACAATAGLFCLLANLLPYPLTALGKSRRASSDFVSMLRLTLDNLTDSFFSDEANEYKSDSSSKELGELQGLLDTLQKSIQDAWYESRFSSRSRDARKMMKRLHQHLQDSCERIQTAQQACTQQVCDDMPVESLRPHVGGVVREAGRLLTFVCEACGRGEVTAQQHLVMHDAAEALDAYLLSLADAFREAKQEAALPEISEETVPEHVFCQLVSQFGRGTIKLADEIRASAAGACPMFRLREAKGVKGIFDWSLILQRKRLSAALLRLAKILVSFWLGWLHWLPLEGRRPYNAGVANMQVILLTQATTGSAMLKNLARLQGVVMGTCVGSMAHASFCYGHEDWYLMLCFSYGVFIAVSLYIYFHSALPANSYTGFLLAVFGSYGFVSPCAAQGGVARQATELFNSVMDIITALTISVALDTLLAPCPAVQAAESMEEAWDDLRKALSALLDPDAATIRFSRSCLLEKASAASALGSEAAREPRCSRAPWKEDVFNRSVAGLRRIGQRLSSLERSVVACHRGSADSLCSSSSGGEIEHAKLQLLRRILGLDSAKRLAHVLRGCLHSVSQLLAVFRHDVATRMKVLESPEVWKDDLSEWQSSYRAFLAECDELLAVEAQQSELLSGRTIESNPAAKAGLLAATLSQIYFELRSIKQGLLSA